MRFPFSKTLAPAPELARSPCESALAALPHHWTGELTLERQRALRAHLLECADCKAEYVRTSELTSAIARDGRLGRKEAELKARRRWLASLGRESGIGHHRMWMRTLLLPAILILLLARKQPTESFARVCAEQGAYMLGERTLASEHKPQRLLRGDRVVAAAGATVKLFDDAAELRAAGPASLVAVTPGERRYVLGPGTFEVRGAHVLTTPWAVIELDDGAARIAIGDDGGRIELLAGAGRVVRARGVDELAIGALYELGAAHGTQSSGASH
jgi:hypothetical protein